MEEENEKHTPAITWDKLKQLDGTAFFDRTIHRVVSDRTDDGYEMDIWDTGRDESGKLRSVEFRKSKRFLYKGHPIFVIAKRCYYDETVQPPMFEEMRCEFECPSGKIISITSYGMSVMDAVNELIAFVERGASALPHDLAEVEEPVPEDAVYQPIHPCPKCGCNLTESAFSIQIVKPATLELKCVKCGHSVVAELGSGNLIKNWNEWKEETD